MKLLRTIKWVLAAGVGLVMATAHAQIPIDLSSATPVVSGKDKLLVKKVSVPGFGLFDVGLRWDPNTVSFQVDGVTPVLANVVGLSINGVASVSEGQTATFTAMANFDDATSAAVVPTWSVSNTAVASITAAGVLSIKPISADASVTVTASYERNGKTSTASKSVSIVNVPSPLVAVTIQGPSSVNEGESTTLTATARMEDGSTTTVTPEWSLSVQSPATITSAGVLTGTPVTSAVTIVVFAKYTLNGVTVTGRLEMKVLDKPAPIRSCSAVMDSSSLGAFSGDFVIDPATKTITGTLIASSGSPNFFYSSLFLIQSGRSLEFTTSASRVNEGTALLMGLSGFAGSGTLLPGILKQIQLSSFPFFVDLSQPFQLFYDGIRLRTYINC